MRVAWPSCLGAVMLCASVAHGQPKKCVAHHAAGKKLRGDGSLIAAKDEFLQCAVDACPKIVREECRELVSKLAQETPSIVVAVKDDAGKDLTVGRVSLDGKELEGWMGGMAQALDPGPHTIDYAGPDGREAQVKFIARDGEKRRTVEVVLAPSAGSIPTPPSESPGPGASEAPPPVIAYVLAGVAVVALGSFTYFALDGKSKKSDLDKCKPHCQQPDVDAMRQSFLIGDISLGVGAVALGGSAYFFLAPREPEADSGQPPSARVPLFLQATGTF